MRSRFLSLQAIAIPPKTENPQRLLVLLHGWGANSQDIASLAPYLDLPDYQMIFPNAPFPHPYAPIGRMWYDFPPNYSFQSDPAFHDKSDLVASRQQLSDWLKSLEATTGIPLSRTVLAGFSQGGAMTLDVGLGLPLAALIVLSGYLHAPLLFNQESVRENTAPILMAHGRYDAVVPLTAAQQARDSLIAAGFTVKYYEFDMGHEVQAEILQILQSFVGDALPPLGESTRNDVG